MESKALELPKELWLLVDHLQKNGFEEVYTGLIFSFFPFRNPGKPRFLIGKILSRKSLIESFSGKKKSIKLPCDFVVIYFSRNCKKQT